MILPRIWPGTLALVAIAAIAQPAAGASKSGGEARVTRIIRDVNLLPSKAAARAAELNENVRAGTAVRTGDESRSELTFSDLTINRLGANTVFSFNKAGRDVELDSGSMLLRVPKNSGGGDIRTNAVTVGITGTTVIFESTRAGRCKLVVLEGGARLTLVKHRDQTQYVKAGQQLVVPAGATTLSPPVDIDLNQAMQNPLITDFAPLPSQGLIATAIANQHGAQPGGDPVYPGRPVDYPPQRPGFGLPPGISIGPPSGNSPNGPRRQPPARKRKDRPTTG